MAEMLLFMVQDMEEHWPLGPERNFHSKSQIYPPILRVVNRFDFF